MSGLFREWDVAQRDRTDEAGSDGDSNSDSSDNSDGDSSGNPPPPPPTGAPQVRKGELN